MKYVECCKAASVLGSALAAGVIIINGISGFWNYFAEPKAPEQPHISDSPASPSAILPGGFSVKPR